MQLHDDIMPEGEFAETILQSSPRTAQRLRARREGPPFIKIGRRVFYRREAVRAWLLAQEQAQPRANRGAA